MIDAVLTQHTNGETCGVAKFNQQLAAQLGVPCFAFGKQPCRHPLISIKMSEFTDQRDYLHWLLDTVSFYPTFSFFFHDVPMGLCRDDFLRRAGHVFVGSEAIASSIYLDPPRPEIIVTGCPSTLRGDPSRKGLTILSYGMAHKFNAPHFEKLKALLDAHGQPYTVCVSSAIHEGSPWDETTKEHTARLRDLFGDHLRWLGFLADDALAKEIRDAHTVALFYDPAARANNTTLWAALDAGTPVITNLDAQSPKELQHNVSIWDITQMTEWPDYNGDRQELRAGGHKAAAVYSWDRLIASLTAVHA